MNHSPKKISIPPRGVATSNLQIRVTDNAQPLEYLLPLSANISLITQNPMVTGSGIQLIKGEPSSTIITENSNLTLTVLPPMKAEEHLNNFVNAWISPIGILWTLLAGVAAVISPLVIRIYSKRKKERPLRSDSG